MKNIFIILFLVFSLQSIAIDHYAKESSLNCLSDQTVWSGPLAKEICGNDCLEIKELPFNCKFSKKVDAYIAKTNSENCSDESDCDSKFLNLVCDNGSIGIKNYNLLQVYCAKNIPDHIGIDQDKKATYDLEQQSIATKEAELKAINEAMEKGKKIIALISLQNAKKNLTSEQILIMLNTYSLIKQLLESGALQTAKQEVLKIVPDGTIITAQDITDIIAKIDSFLGVL